MRSRIRYPIAYADWSAREYGAIARCVLTGRVHDGPAPALLAQRLQAMYAPSQVHLLNYAHHGIEMALGMFARQCPARREVIVPAYICPSVPQAVLAAGLQARYVDVGDDLNLSLEAVRLAIGPDTLAVIAPHMYGCPAPIELIEAICGEAGIFLIDDAAQVVGVRVGGRLLGTFGDVGVISFAQSKAVVTGIRGSGGVLLVNRAQWAAEAATLCATLPPATGRLGALADFLWNYVGQAYTGHSGYYIDRVLKLLNVRQRSHGGATRISNMEAAVALVQMARLELMLQKRCHIVQAYSDALQSHTDLVFPQYAEGRYLARVMLQLPPGVDLAKTRSALRDLGVETRVGYAVPISAQGHASHASVLAERLLGMPTGSSWTKSDVASICAALQQVIVCS